eukprot:gb/GEZN01009925.1/.p1 GENE.gb/GEZN01009925.1/~~gb/GEZN01009925.1/.p1  ORF type:complete len:250 (-),score=11.87 gb/GEZN01009925.1/:468-1217(-)
MIPACPSYGGPPSPRLQTSRHSLRLSEGYGVRLSDGYGQVWLLVVGLLATIAGTVTVTTMVLGGGAAVSDIRSQEDQSLLSPRTDKSGNKKGEWAEETRDLQEQNELLQQRLASTALLFSRSILNVGPPLRCSCEQYCGGQCFAPQCGVCGASAFSFPGGQHACVRADPFGLGLLCHVHRSSGQVSASACCQTLTSNPDTSCVLPAGSCCAMGDCQTCPDFPRPKLRFPELTGRHFNSTTNTCSDSKPP